MDKTRLGYITKKNKSNENRDIEKIMIKENSTHTGIKRLKRG